MEATPLENWIIQKSGIGEGSRKLLEEYQLNQIKKTIEYTKSRSRFYGEILRDINPNDISCLNDIRKIPFTFPQDIQKDPFAFSCVPQSKIKRVVTLNTTGTSGKEKRVFFSEEDLAQTVEFFIHGMKSLTDETDRVMVLLPGDSCGSIGDLLKKALEQLGVECFVNGVVIDPEETARDIIDKRISCLVGIPSQIMRLSRQRSDVFESTVKSVLLSTDYVPETLIHELTDKHGCRVFTHYGMTEMGYGGGVECGALNGYHMREAELLFEIVKPETGEPLPDGQWGEVVFTTLNRTAMPLIRYRTGDIAAFSEEPCPCGTFLKTMKRVSGRLNNRVEICGNEFLYQSELDEIILPFRELRDYKAYLTKNNCLTLELEADESAFERIKDRVSAGINKYIDERFGSAANIKITLLRKEEADKVKNSMVKRIINDLRKQEAAMRTGAVIAAAGMSSRMKAFKPMLEIDSQSAVRRIILTLRQAGASPIVLVTGNHAELLEEHVSDLNVVCLRNEEYATTQMLDSAKIGLSYLLDKCDNILFTPVDVPLFSVDSVKCLLCSKAEISVPVCGGVEGHPLLLSRAAVKKLLAYSGEGGLSLAVERSSFVKHRVEVDDEGVLFDMDTPEDYEKMQMLRKRLSITVSDYSYSRYRIEENTDEPSGSGEAICGTFT